MPLSGGEAVAAGLWYEERGSGDPILLLHGWCKTSAVWTFQLERLSARFRVIAPDLAGYGRSGKSSAGYNLEDYAADIAALIEHLKLGRVLLAGWSQGGQIAMQVALQIREQLAGLVLISTTPRFVSADDFPYGLSRSEADGMAARAKRHLGRAVAGFNMHMFAARELEHSPVGERVRQLLAQEPLPDAGTALQGLEALYRADLRDRLPLLDLPVLIVNGDLDPICLPGASEYMAERIPAARRKIFNGCGHAPFLSCPDLFADCINDFYRGIKAIAR